MSKAILQLVDFQKLPLNEQADLLQSWRESYKNKDILNGMGIDANTLYKLIHQFGLPKRKRDPWELPRPQATNLSELRLLRERRATRASSLTSPDVDQDFVSSTGTTNGHAGTAQPYRFVMELNGNYTGQDITAKFAGLAKLLEGDSRKYKVTFQIQQVD